MWKHRFTASWEQAQTLREPSQYQLEEISVSVSQFGPKCYELETERNNQQKARQPITDEWQIKYDKCCEKNLNDLQRRMIGND